MGVSAVSAKRPQRSTQSDFPVTQVQGKTVAMIRKLALLLALIAPPAVAGPTPADVDFLSGWQNADGTRMAALRIRLDPGWKTYWRAPGDAGIPPLFDFSGSSNLGGVKVHWPAPEVFHSDGMRIVAYKREVVLPLSLSPADPGAPVDLDLRLEFGVCKDICMPMQLEMNTRLEAEGTRHPSIVAALLDQPAQGPGGLHCEIDPAEQGFRVALTVPHAPAESVIEAGEGMLWVSEPSVKAAPEGMTATAQVVAQGAILDRSALRLTVLPKTGGAVEYVGCD